MSSGQGLGPERGPLPPVRAAELRHVLK